MNAIDIITNRIDSFSEGYVFTYSDFGDSDISENNLSVALYRLAKVGKIAKLSKGRFYKPKKGITGNLMPDAYEVVKDLLVKDSKTVGYITGYTVFNQLKLTTQVSNIIQIGASFDRKELKRLDYRIKFVRQWNNISKKNIPLLQLLDCFRFVKDIPDTTIDVSLNRLKVLFEELSEEQRKQLVNLSIAYPPSAKALLGALLEVMGYDDYSEKIYNSLNPVSAYTFNISKDILPNQEKWKIK